MRAQTQPTGAVRRLREVAACVALTAMAFLQAPGLVLVDSKVDLSVNPVGWLARSLHMWNSSMFGQVQDQAYGYLWPMGPFYAVGSGLGMPPWVIQRLFWALLMCLAFIGLVRLADRLGIGTPTTRLIAGVAFALSPRVLTQLGWTSVEAWPTALAPWVLLPLVGLAAGGRLRPAVTRSALAVACAGGVNATAVFAVVPLALLWLGTLQPLRRRLTAIAAWCGAVALATAWWVVPLLLLGRYSPPFLDYIESADVTTRVTDATSNLRGASYWLAYLTGPYGPTLPAGHRLATETLLIAATIVIAALGVAGLARRGMPHRRFLVTGLLVGLALVGLGHASAVDGGLSGPLRAFLDGPGAPLRNLHKFDVVLRLPLLLGVAHLLGVLARLGSVVRNGVRPARAPALVATAAAVVAVAVGASPALAGGLATPGGMRAVPEYWHDATDWLDQRGGREHVLLVPGASFPHYTWGATSDEIAQPLLDDSWVVRNALPLTPPTTVRLLDAVEKALATGGGSAGLADLLARSGVRYVLLRSDLDYGRSNSTRPLVARQALERSPGLSSVAEFGPTVGGEKFFEAFIDRGLRAPQRALEVFEVHRTVLPVVAFDSADVTAVVGGPESLLEMAAAGQLSAAPTVLAGDLPAGSTVGSLALTDGLRRREVAFGSLRENTSQTLTATDSYDTGAPAHDYLPSWGADSATTMRYDGIARVRATTSWSQAHAAGGARPEYQPFAAVDGDPATSWRPAPGTVTEGQWLEVELVEPQPVREVVVRFDLAGGRAPTRVTVTAGTERASTEVFGDAAVVRLPGVHSTRTVRVTIDSILGLGTVGITELELPGLETSRTLVVPAAPATAAPAAASVVLTAAPTTPSCYFVDGVPLCVPDAARGSEDGDQIDRTATLPAGSLYEPRIWVRPRPGPDLNALLDEHIAGTATDPAPAVTASSTSVSDPVGRPGVVVDRDPATTWSPAATDRNPLLRLAWDEPRVIEGLRVSLPFDVAATRPATVRVVGDDGVRGGFLYEDGVVAFDPPMRTDEITIMILDPPRALSFEPYTNTLETLPIAVGEVTVLPLAGITPPNLGERIDVPCGGGPTLEAGGRRIQTRFTATVRDLLQLREVAATPCAVGDGAPANDIRMPLGAGVHRIVASGSDLAVPSRIALVPDGLRSTPFASPVRIDSWAPTERRLHVDARDAERILAIRENTNPGWQATAGDAVLTPIVIDGWQQGWWLPAGFSGEVVLRFVPQQAYRAGLLGGAALLLGILILAVLPARKSGSHARRPKAILASTTGGGGRAIAIALGGLTLVLIGGVVGALVAFTGLMAVAYRSVASASAPQPRGNQEARRLLRAAEVWLPGVLVLLAGWLSLTADQGHRAAGPQTLVLLAVGGLWLSVVAGPSARPTRRPLQEGSLQQVIAGGGYQQSAAEGQQVGAKKVAGEQRTITKAVDGLQHQEVPQEDPVGDRA